MTENAVNINRGSYQAAYDNASMVLETREMLAEMFNADDCRNVVFTKNVTESLNVILNGYLKPGDHVLVSSMEHNAVMRPLVKLSQSGISFTRIPCNEAGELCIDTLESLLQQNTKHFSY